MINNFNYLLSGPSGKSSGRFPFTLDNCGFKQTACECQHRPFPQQMRFATGIICVVFVWIIVWHFVQTKLEAGVRLNQHMISYGDRPNDYDSVSTCNRLSIYKIWWCLTLSLLDFRHKFGVIHQSYTPNKERELYSTFNTTTLALSISIISLTSIDQFTSLLLLIQEGPPLLSLQVHWNLVLLYFHTNSFWH